MRLAMQLPVCVSESDALMAVFRRSCSSLIAALRLVERAKLVKLRR